jgi:hypothetical protein
MSKSISEVYGFYGGVSNQNYYVPPASPDFVPKPPNSTSVLSEQDRILLEQINDRVKFYKDNAPNILLRSNVSSLPGNVDTFVISTSGKPEDQIVYTSNEDVIDISPGILDGGRF